jgi:hypothetical protein
MNKSINTLLFVLGATLFNVIIAVVSFIGLMFLYVGVIMPRIPDVNHSWGFAFTLLASLAISFVAYRFLFKYLVKKIDVDKYFAPLFARKYKK